MILVRLVALAALALALSACADDEPEPRVDPTPTVSTSTSPTPDPTPTGPVEPTLPPEAKQDSPAGAEAFVAHFWRVANYAQSAYDPEAFARLTNELCEGCRAAIDALREVSRLGGTIEGGIATVDDMRTEALTAGDGTAYRVTFELSTTRQVVRVPDREDRVFPASSVTDRFVVDRQKGRWLVGVWEVLE
jgi:hypothetical protein